LDVSKFAKGLAPHRLVARIVFQMMNKSLQPVSVGMMDVGKCVYNKTSNLLVMAFGLDSYLLLVDYESVVGFDHVPQGVTKFNLRAVGEVK
jgi:hypothetical protein